MTKDLELARQVLDDVTHIEHWKGAAVQLARALLSAHAPEGRVGVFVPQEVWDWLMGEGPDFQPSAKQLEGSVFAPGRYWWRSELRRRIESSTPQRMPTK